MAGLEQCSSQKVTCLFKVDFVLRRYLAVIPESQAYHILLFLLETIIVPRLQ